MQQLIITYSENIFNINRKNYYRRLVYYFVTLAGSVHTMRQYNIILPVSYIIYNEIHISRLKRPVFDFRPSLAQRYSDHGDKSY